MNIVTKSSLLLIATLATGLISIQSHANVYVMLPVFENSSYIWMLNTETGQVRKCNGRGTTEPPKCGPWSEE